MFNWGSAVLTQAADLVTGHELGHNFGSNHDPPSCVPSVSEGGSYLMLARAVSGKQPNNRHFSQCSRDGIGRILSSLGDYFTGQECQVSARPQVKSNCISEKNSENSAQHATEATAILCWILEFS